MKKNFCLTYIIFTLLSFILSAVGIFAIIKSTLASYVSKNLLLQNQFYYIQSYIDKTKTHIGVFVGLLFLLHSAILYKIWRSNQKAQEKKEEKIAKEVKKKESEKYRQEKNKGRPPFYVFDKMHEGLILMDTQKKIIHINASAKKFLNIEARTPCLQKNIVYATRNKEFNEQLDYALKKGQSSTTLKINEKYLKIYVNSILDQEKVEGLFSLIIDETLLYQEERNRRKFTTNITHELKTPLTSIAGYAEIIKHMEVSPEETQEFSEKIIKNTQNMLGMIDNIIKLSSLDGGESIEKETIDLGDIVENVLKNHEIQAQVKDIRIHKEIEKNAHIKGNPGLIRDMVNNLVSNAIRYNIEQGYIEIQVKTQAEKVVFSVKDTGVGIPEKYKEKVFERFFVVDKSRSKQLGGSGLGLSIVKHIVKVHKAKIHLESQENVGTKIQVEFERSS